MAILHIASAKVTQVVHVRGNRGYYSTPYPKDWAIDDFKKAVPWQKRKWDGSAWSCTLPYLYALKQLASEFGPVEVQEAQ